MHEKAAFVIATVVVVFATILPGARAESDRERDARYRYDRAARQVQVDFAAWKVPAPRVAAKPERIVGGDFWWHLANCESGVGKTSRNMFQFMGGTENKVGYHSGASYEEQKHMAQRWASMIRNPGSTEGWPHCWWVAKSKTGGP